MYYVDNFSNMKKNPFIIALFLFCGIVPPVFAQTQLLMAEEDGCYWCNKWHQEVGHIYPKTLEGKAAPLINFDLHNGYTNVDFAKGISFTPTFILINDGTELGRIEGYPGEDFFWALLGMLFSENNIPLDQLDG